MVKVMLMSLDPTGTSAPVDQERGGWEEGTVWTTNTLYRPQVPHTHTHTHTHTYIYLYIKVKVKFTLEKTTKAQSGVEV